MPPFDWTGLLHHDCLLFHSLELEGVIVDIYGNYKSLTRLT